MLKGVLASALISQSLRTGTPLQVIATLVGIAAFNVNSAKFYVSGEVYYLIQLFTNLGYLISLVKVFNPFIVEIWFISLDLRYLFVFVCSGGVACFHLHVLLFPHNYYFFPHNYYFFCYRFIMNIIMSFSAVAVATRRIIQIGWYSYHHFQTFKKAPIEASFRSFSITALSANGSYCLWHSTLLSSSITTDIPILLHSMCHSTPLTLQ